MMKMNKELIRRISYWCLLVFLSLAESSILIMICKDAIELKPSMILADSIFGAVIAGITYFIVIRDE